MTVGLRRRFPPLSNLLALEAIARRGSVTLAASDLCLSQSAVSKQVAELERFLGVELLKRRSGGVSLTPSAQRYLDEVGPALGELERVTRVFIEEQQGVAALRVSVPPTFGTTWLMPRLPAFSTMNPHITIDLLTWAQPGMVDMGAMQLDVAIALVDERGRPKDSALLFRNKLYPVFAPELLRSTQISAREALGVLPLIRQSALQNTWPPYLQLLGIQRLDDANNSSPAFGLMGLAIQAALQKMGVALLPDFVAAADIQAGRLVRLVETPFEPDHGYYIQVAAGREGASQVTKFVDWVLGQVNQ